MRVAIKRQVDARWLVVEKFKKSSHELVSLLRRGRGSLSVCCPTHIGQPSEARPVVPRMGGPRLLDSRAKRTCLCVIKYNWRSLKTKVIWVVPHVSHSLGVPSDARSFVDRAARWRRLRYLSVRKYNIRNGKPTPLQCTPRTGVHCQPPEKRCQIGMSDTGFVRVAVVHKQSEHQFSIFH